MNNLEWLASLNPAVAVPMGILALLFAALGLGPLKARSKNRQAKEEVETNDFRRTDDAANRADARAMRAEAARDVAQEQRDFALEAKRKAIEEATEKIQAARDDVHDVRNAALIDMSACRRQCEAEVNRIQHAADARISENNLSMQSLVDRMAATDRRLVQMTEQNAECERRNGELTQALEETNLRLDRMIERARFDPTKSITQ